MKKLTRKGFTLVELLVVITILAIISVVAYQNFGGAVDKAVSSRKISDVATIETSLQQFKVDKNYYPAVDEYDANTNRWGYDKTSKKEASASNTIQVTMKGAEISSIGTDVGGGGVVKNKDASQQIGAKGTISQATLTKQYLTKDLYDPEVGDYKVKDAGKIMIDYGIGRYVYGVYRKPTGPDWDGSNKTGTYYNIAYTVKKEDSDTYVTKVVGDYDNESCFDDKDNCPGTLIGSGDKFLVNGQEQGKNDKGESLTGSYGSKSEYQGIPYSVDVFEE